MRTDDITCFIYVITLSPEQQERLYKCGSKNFYALIDSGGHINAQLRGEQRLHPNLKHCAINTKAEVEAKVPSVVNPS
jgi:hypothetical protein